MPPSTVLKGRPWERPEIIAASWLPGGFPALAALVGRPASDAGGRGNVGSADGGVALVVASASCAPGALLRTLRALREAGHFTVAALALPFGFEGGVRGAAARRAAAEARAAAHLVALVDQEVLMQAWGGGAAVTVAQATEIADLALEHAVRGVLQAVQSREILKSQRGALMWHGRELRHFKRLLPPPLQQLLTRPGFALTGRGQACMPPSETSRLSPAKALMHLATDAVRAAADSPFLDGVLGDTRGVLCCLTLPSPLALGVDVGSERALQQHKAAERMAAQAAAGALSQLAGPGCRDLVLCVEVEAAAHSPGDAARGVVRLEATLLALHDAEAAGEVEDLDAGDDGYQPSISSSPVARGNDGPAVPAQPPAPPSPALADTQPAQRITVGDDLSDALMAASLDLPPAAARWRQQQRAQAAPPRKVVVWEVDELQPWEEPEEPSGLAALLPGPWVRPRELKINLKQRIAGVLEQDRDEGWGEDAEP
ncbi:hypothetical protein F751_6747 [Auxenochlorella protothecoides]|uniref:Uncharacterized protein n=1 Tax=Auxenochlorella protothecoides TaxID=3075 RepID=A0A087SAG2_AUXPR|nr:hypothetical protein F751_6747 [Auxenochlorella protothecoides]KFM22716.1 hypothetical protein F751_6747 [Auxenochlorella protothecoides]